MQQVEEMDKMKFSIEHEHEQQQEDSDGITSAEDQRIVVPSKFIAAATADGFEKREQSW